MTRLLRAAYDWVLHWAETPYGAPALFFLAFAEASFFPLPPDLLLIALCLSLPARYLRYTLVCLAGSVLGGIGGYLLGAGLWSLVSGFFFHYIPGFTPELFARVQQLFDAYGFWAVFTAGFTPIPYKVFTISSGVFQISFGLFCLASAISRGLRFFLVAWLIRQFGPPVKVLIERHFNWLSLVFTALLIGSFFLVKLLE